MSLLNEHYPQRLLTICKHSCVDAIIEALHQPLHLILIDSIAILWVIDVVNLKVFAQNNLQCPQDKPNSDRQYC